MSTQSFVVQAAAIAWVLAGSAAFSQAPRAADPAAAVAPPALNGPIVKVSQGEVQGTVADGVAVFKGLPFAAPPAQRATMFGLPHGGEIAYVFNTPRATPFDQEGKAVASAANKYWAQFAKTGEPDAAGGPMWPKFDAADEYVMEFPATAIPLAAKHFHKDRLDWVEVSLAK
jgi:carboxylesterase type B